MIIFERIPGKQDVTKVSCLNLAFDLSGVLILQIRGSHVTINKLKKTAPGKNLISCHSMEMDNFSVDCTAAWRFIII